MLKIEVHTRDCFEFFHHTVDVLPNSSKSNFESSTQELGDVYLEGEALETIAYFNSDFSIEIYISGDMVAQFKGPDCLRTTINESHNFLPTSTITLGTSRLIWAHDMKFFRQYIWPNINTFNAELLRFNLGNDHNNQMYFLSISYAGVLPFDCEDLTSVGSGYTKIMFSYNPEQKWNIIP